MWVADPDMAHDTHDDLGRWHNLLVWLRESHGMNTGREELLVECRNSPGAGKGLYTLQRCPPSSVLFTIPAKAMINSKTLSSLYPRNPKSPPLKADQTISLHLLLYRPIGDEDSQDPDFGPYISTMPRNFDSHPLTWTVNRFLREAGLVEECLLEILPPGIQSSLRALTARFWEDWNAICQYTQTNPHLFVSSPPRRNSTIFRHKLRKEDLASVKEYIWAWLNVNTRCIFYQLDASSTSPSNLTMCPILDFANHTPSDTQIVPLMPSNNAPRPLKPDPRTPRAKVGGDYTFISSGMGLERDQEIFLRYGGHSNRKLFVEYGFVNLWPEGSVLKGEVTAEVDVEDIIQGLFEKRGALGVWMKRVLEEEGYWGDWTLHSSPPPAHPSYRLITALRLFHIIDDKGTSLPLKSEKLVAKWKDVINGNVDAISPSNEQEWRQGLLAICDQVVLRAKTGLEGIARSTFDGQSPEWLEWMKGNIRCLWQEELEVAQAVILSVESGEEF